MQPDADPPGDPPFALVAAVVGRWAARHPSIAAAWIFGSRARGDARPDSDVDVALAMMSPGFEGLGDLIFDGSEWQAELARDLRAATGRAVAVGGIEHADPKSNAEVWPHILADGRLVFERDVGVAIGLGWPAAPSRGPRNHSAAPG